MSDNKDLDHTRSYIRLFQMQLHGVLEDMATPAETLSIQFSDALAKLYDLKNNLSSDHTKDDMELAEEVQCVINELFECISCMQFVDAKRQRIEHVADGLSYLIEKDKTNKNMKYDWEKVKSLIIEQYKMDKERDIYQMYLQDTFSETGVIIKSEAN